MKARNLGLLSALFASSCCAVPLLLIMLGLGGIGAGGILGKYHWYSQGAAVVLLSVAWGVWYREKRRAYALAADFKGERFTPKLLGAASLFVAFFIGSSVYANLLDGSSAPSANAEQATIAPAGYRTANLHVEGMSCSSCASHIKEEMAKLPGIFDVDVSVRGKSVTVRYNPDQVQPPRMVQVINEAGYKAELPAQG
ncbi:MAG: heavy-metal-associated domain-containing protein [Nitrospirae bacterium]|nr:heavy-metal-associated domain-containing protein [Nitrospirota bacterium]